MLVKSIKNLSKILVAIMLLLIYSCEDRLVDDLEPNSKLITTQEFELPTLKDEIASEVALNLATKLEHIELRNFIKEKAIEQFDGDYNFLIELAKNEAIALAEEDRNTTVKFGELLSENLQRSSADLLESISVNYPLLQVAVPSLSHSDAESWDTELHIPLVAFVPSNYEETHKIPAYDAKGNKYLLSSLEEPEQLVIVVSENERTMIFDKKTAMNDDLYAIIQQCDAIRTPYFSNRNAEFYLRADVFNRMEICGGSGGPGGGGSGTGTCDRDRKSGKDRLNQMIFNSMNDFNSVNEWFDGGVDLEVTVFFGQANGAVTKVTKAFYGKDKKFKNCGLFDCDPKWFDLNDAEIVTWDKDTYGDAMLYSWIEKDSGDEIKWKLSFSSKFKIGLASVTNTYSIERTIKKGDDILGESVVEYCDNTDGNGYTYNTGKIKFQVKQ